ncbi:MAG: site-specific integrase [Chthoniobacteraceae bacterium]
MKQIEEWKIKRSAEICARSYNYERDTLAQIFEYAREHLRIILENPMDAIKRRKVTKEQIIIPSRDQFRVLLAQLREERRAKDAADFVEFLGYSGLRLGEATQVCWEHINFKLETLLVTGGDIGTKNHEQRLVPLFPPLRRLLESLKAAQAAQPAKGRKFPPEEGSEGKRGSPLEKSPAQSAIAKDKKRASAPTGRIFTLDSAKKALLSACKKAALPQFGHHAMRHFFCSNAIEAGCDFKVIAGWLGHKDGGVLVAQTYGHLRNEHSAAMAKRITFDANTP